ncbi:MAG: ATP-binding response regulator [Candidatus Acidiferrales bacterium]
MAHVSADGLILYANKRFAYLIGGEALVIEPNKTHLRDMVSTDCWVDLDKGLKLAVRQRVCGSLRVEEPREHIPVRTVRLILAPVRWKSKITIKINATEMTELLAKNRELQEKEESLHAISARIMQLQDEERRRIARDLHDITGQELAVVIMLLMQASREIRSDTESLKTITDAAGMIRKIEEEIRTLSYILHPPLLDELGLGPALNWYIEGFSKRSAIEVKLDLQQGLPRLHKDKELALFRVVQEALTNVMRHSGSGTAQIQIAFNADAVTLSIRDEGKGISRKRFTKSSEKILGVGIMGMRERIQQFGGGIEIRPLNTSGKGTEVMTTIPIGHAPPIETPFTDDDILQMAKALGYQEGMPPAAAPPAHDSANAAEQTEAPSAAPSASDRDEQPAAKQTQAPRVRGRQTAPVQPPADSAASSAKKRILIADDHEITRQGIRSMLQDQADIQICGESSNGLETILKAKQLSPDLIIMDMSMPGGGGYSAATKIRGAHMPSKILFFTTHQSTEIERMARITGFEGLVQKADAARDLLRGIRAIFEGNRFFGAQVIPQEEKPLKRRTARTGAA